MAVILPYLSPSWRYSLKIFKAVYRNIVHKLDFARGLLNTMMRNPKIVIVGAGASGIAAAMKLQEHGFTDVRLLEAENRIGGRIHTVTFGKNVVDLGAQWCHGEEDNIVYETVKKLDLLETSLCNYKDNLFYDSTGRLVDKQITDILFGIAARITYDYDIMKNIKGSFGDYFIRRYIDNVKREFGMNKTYLEVANMFVHWFHKLILCYDAPPNWFDISASGLLQYKDCDGDPLLNWKDKGFKIFLNVLMKNPTDEGCNPLEDRILLNKEVKTILWNNNFSSEAVLHCSDGTSFSADHVIITVPIGVLKEQTKLFVPELPFYKLNAIKGQGFGTVNKIMIKFPHRWWDPNNTSFCFLWTEDDRMNVLNQFPVGPIKNGRSWLEDINGFYVVDSDPTILLAWLVGDFVPEVELLDDQILEKGCMFLLEKFLGDRFEIPHPIDTIWWFSSQHFRGSYSYKSVEGEKRETLTSDLSEPIFVDNKPILLFAGEATHPHYYSTVHGAVETGFREANRIVHFYRYDTSERLSLENLKSKY